MRRTGFTFIIALLGALWAGTIQAQTIKPRPIDSGINSQHQGRKYTVITSDADWKSFWSSHANAFNQKTPPKVDFKKERVLAVVMGRQSTGGYAISIQGVTELPKKIEVQVWERHPGPNETVTKMMTNPYHIVAIPAGSKSVFFDITRQVGPKKSSQALAQKKAQLKQVRSQLETFEKDAWKKWEFSGTWTGTGTDTVANESFDVTLRVISLEYFSFKSFAYKTAYRIHMTRDYGSRKVSGVFKAKRKGDVLSYEGDLTSKGITGILLGKKGKKTLRLEGDLTKHPEGHLTDDWVRTSGKKTDGKGDAELHREKAKPFVDRIRQLERDIAKLTGKPVKQPKKKPKPGKKPGSVTNTAPVPSTANQPVTNPNSQPKPVPSNSLSSQPNPAQPVKPGTGVPVNPNQPAPPTKLKPAPTKKGLQLTFRTDKKVYTLNGKKAWVTVRFEIENPTNKDLTIQHPNSQRFDFTIRDASGKSVVRWSQGMMFPQIPITTTVQANDDLLLMATVTIQKTGTYTVEGELVGKPNLKGTTSFEVKAPKTP